MVPLKSRKKAQRGVKREDAQTWRDRLVGKRLVTYDPQTLESLAARHTNCPEKDPNVYSYKPPGEGFDKNLEFSIQINCRLLQLPAEIRNRILEYTLSPLRPLQDTYSSHCGWDHQGSIVFACKQLYGEARVMALQLNTFPYEGLQARTSLQTNAPGLIVYSMYSSDRLNVTCDWKSGVVLTVRYG